MNDKYEKIIDLNYEGVKKHERMSRVARAAQFAPFAALTGFDDKIDETNRVTEEKVEFSEEHEKQISDALNLIEKEITSGNFPAVKITVFVHDETKPGGRYLTEKIKVKKINGTERFLESCIGEKIKFSSLACVELIDEEY